MNEPGISGAGLVVRGRHHLFLHPAATAARDHRPKAQQIYFEPTISFTAATTTTTMIPNKEFSALSSPLPLNVHLLTLEPWGPSGSDVLLRLEHYFEKGEDAVFSLPVKVDLARAFEALKLEDFVEMTLGANKVKATATRLKWKAKDGSTIGGDVGVDETLENKMQQENDGGFLVTLNPMQIRTFVAKRRA